MIGSVAQGEIVVPKLQQCQSSMMAGASYRDCGLPCTPTVSKRRFFAAIHYFDRKALPGDPAMNCARQVGVVSGAGSSTLKEMKGTPILNTSATITVTCLT